MVWKEILMNGKEIPTIWKEIPMAPKGKKYSFNICHRLKKTPSPFNIANNSSHSGPTNTTILRTEEKNTFPCSTST